MCSMIVCLGSTPGGSKTLGIPYSNQVEVGCTWGIKACIQTVCKHLLLVCLYNGVWRRSLPFYLTSGKGEFYNCIEIDSVSFLYTVFFSHLYAPYLHTDFINWTDIFNNDS